MGRDGVIRAVSAVRVLVCMAALFTFAPGQVLKGDATPHLGEVRIELPALRAPSLLVVEGSRPAAADTGLPRPDAELTLDGKPVGRLSDFAIGRDHFRIHIPIDVTPQDRGRRPVFEAAPRPRGLLLGPVTLARAGVLEVDLVDPLGVLLPGIVEIVSAGGGAPPLFGRAPHSPHAGPAWLLGSGSGRVLVPAGARLKLLAWTHPFHAPTRREVRAGRGGRTAVRLVLGPDLRPHGAAILELPHAEGLDAKGRELTDNVLGVTARDKHPEIVAAEMVLTVPELFWTRLLREDRLPPVVTDRTRPCGLPAGPRTPRTLKLESGRLLHSNGPMLIPGPIVRNRDTRRVDGVLDVRFHSDVVPDRLVLRTADKTLLELPMDRSQRVPLDLKIAPGTRVLATFSGKRFAGDPLAGPKPMAAIILVMP